MDQIATPAQAAARIRRFLEQEPVAWLSMIREDGLPHIVPVWFWWDGETILIFSKPHAVKVRALRANPTAMLALGDPDDDFDVGLLEARAELLERRPALPAGFVAKYGAKMPAGHLDPDIFDATYTQAIPPVPTRWLPWHGRSARKPIHPTWRERLGRVLGSLRPTPLGRPLAADAAAA